MRNYTFTCNQMSFYERLEYLDQNYPALYPFVVGLALLLFFETKRTLRTLFTPLLYSLSFISIVNLFRLCFKYTLLRIKHVQFEKDSTKYNLGSVTPTGFMTLFGLSLLTLSIFLLIPRSIYPLNVLEHQYIDLLIGSSLGIMWYSSYKLIQEYKYLLKLMKRKQSLKQSLNKIRKLRARIHRYSGNKRSKPVLLKNFNEIAKKNIKEIRNN